MRGKYAWEEVKLVRGSVVEFVMEFCPKVVAAVGFDAGLCDAIALHFCPMPPKETTKTKKWGQANRDLLADPRNRQLINITNTTYPNIDQVRELHFWHRDKNNFRRNVGPRNRV